MNTGSANTVAKVKSQLSSKYGSVLATALQLLCNDFFDQRRVLDRPEFAVDVKIAEGVSHDGYRHHREREVNAESIIKTLEEEAEGDPKRGGSANEQYQMPMIAVVLHFSVQSAKQSLKLGSGIATRPEREYLLEVVVAFLLNLVKLLL